MKALLLRYTVNVHYFILPNGKLIFNNDVIYYNNSSILTNHTNNRQYMELLYSSTDKGDDVYYKEIHLPHNISYYKQLCFIYSATGAYASTKDSAGIYTTPELNKHSRSLCGFLTTVGESTMHSVCMTFIMPYNNNHLCAIGTMDVRTYSSEEVVTAFPISDTDTLYLSRIKNSLKSLSIAVYG